MNHMVPSTDSNQSRDGLSSTGSHPRKLGLWMLVGLTYYSVSGGPLGIEPTVEAGGPALALLGFIIMPLVWSLPEALMTAELSIAYPEAAGFSAWTNAAFGPFWSFMCSFMSWLSGVIDNAVYPVLLIQYIAANGTLDDWPSLVVWLAILGFTAALTWLTWRGLDVNGKTCLVLTGFIIIPFLVFAILGIPQISPSNWLKGPPDGKDIDWRTLLNTLFWNLNYYDSASAFSGDCQDPPRMFPKAMYITLVFVSATYLVPLAVASGAEPTEDYCDGCLVKIANRMVGSWMGVWITCATAVSCVGLFIAEMASDSFQIMGMSDRGQLPKFLGTRSRHGTPTYGILLSATGVLALSRLDFTAIIELVNILYVVSELIEFAAFVELRRKFPDQERPFKIPIEGNFQCALFFIPASMFLLTIVFFSSTLGFIFASSAIVFATVIYILFCAAREKKWLAFEPVDDAWSPRRDPWVIRWALAKSAHRTIQTQVSYSDDVIKNILHADDSSDLTQDEVKVQPNGYSMASTDTEELSA